ncbi:MAG: ComEC/Rec2 family competence protein [Bacteroidota bacterium]
MKRTPVIRILVPFSIGSLSGYLGSMVFSPGEVIIPGVIICAALVLVWIIFRRDPVVRSICFSPLAFVLFFWTGVGGGVVDRPADPGLPMDERVMIMGRILEKPVERNGRMVFEVDLRAVAGTDTFCRTRTVVKVYMFQYSTVDSSDEQDRYADLQMPVPGETWCLTGRLVAIRNNGNPGEVDYATILKRKNRWYRFYCDKASNGSCRLPVMRRGALSAAQVREEAMARWDGPDQVVSLLRAVCLGDRSGLSEETREFYQRAGGMHVLAVSGLHVGLIWWVLHRALSPLVRLLRKEIFRVVLILALLWFYAWVTGFSSSVCRSVTMFSLFSASRLMSRRSHSVNVVLVSMFLLIVLHPGRMLDVGFQLSYAAVLAIVTIHPVFRKSIRTRNPLLKWIWEATGISLAAQLGTLPLVVYYFHQVPVYALITNLLAIPLLSCIIALFVVSVPFMLTGAGTAIINRLLILLGGLMNSSMEAIASIPGSVLGNLFMDPLYAVLCMILVTITILWISKPGGALSTLFLLTLVLIFAHNTRIHTSLQSTNQASVAHFRKSSLVTIREGLVVDHYIWCSDPASWNYMDRYIKTAWGRGCYKVSVIRVSETPSGQQLHGGITSCIELSPGVWTVGNEGVRGMVITGEGDVGHPGFLPEPGADFLLLSGEPDLPAGHGTTLLSGSWDLIADGSNRGWYENRLLDMTAQIYLTREKGAYRKQY